jgi:N-acetylmuramoyl-L-alanine amidase
MSIRHRPSPNFGPRKGGDHVDLLILHYTAMESAEASLDRLCDPKAEVSAHYLVDTDGSLWSLVEESKRAWHAGVAYWSGETDINSRSIGIEIQHQGPGREPDPFPRVQMDAVSLLCQDIMQRHRIGPARVLGHSDVAVGRKVDPGPEFPWARLAAEGVGLWVDGAARPELNEDRALSALRSIGYALDAPMTALAAFRLHWVPEVPQNAPLDPLTMYRLETLAGRILGL